MSLPSVGYREVEAIVEKWTKKYQYHISLVESRPNQVKFMVEFSLPQPQQPVPVATIRVYFTCNQGDPLDISFRFEKDSLIHSPQKTIRQQQIEKWIDDSLAKKLLVRETVFYLGTAYEKSRVSDQRLDKIMKEEVPVKEVEQVWIHPDLLADQHRLISIMEKPTCDPEQIQKQLKKCFREVDKENIGVITHSEYLSLIKGLGVKLTPQEEKEVLKRMDAEETGMVEYSDYCKVSGQFLQGLEARRQSEEKLRQNYQEQTFSSILALINDEAQDIEELMLQRFREKDEDETGLTNISEVKTVLDDINKKFKEENKLEPLSVVELADITKVITDAFGYKEIPYAQIHPHIIDYKVRQLAKGRTEAHVNSLQAHLQEIFGKHDEKKNGRIKVESWEEALRRSEKIKLSRAQVYLLKSLLVTEGKGEINYVENAKFLGEFIKRLYLCSSKKRP